MRYEEAYSRLPILLQNAACSAYGQYTNWTRYGGDFATRLYKAESRLALPEEDLAVLRDRRIHAFVKHAVHTTTFYADLFRRIGADPRDFETIASLRHLPILTKADVQAQPNAFVSHAVHPAQRVALHTSGTTGAGLNFFSTMSAIREQYAIWWRYLQRHGVSRGSWWAYFGGRSIVPIDQQHPPYWRVNVPGRQILFSGYHTSPEKLDTYLAELRLRRPLWWHGYPSQLTLLATRATETNFDMGYSPKLITTTSENLMPHQKRAIHLAFGSAPVQHYGMTEAAANFSECEHGALHVDEDFSGVEFTPASNPELFNVIGTNFSNFAVPLIRYDVGDIVRFSSRTCTCGRAGRIVDSVDGRSEDYVMLPNGARVGRLDHVFKDMTNVLEAQIRQDSSGVVAVSIVKGARYSQRDEGLLLSEFRNRLGEETSVVIKYVEHIPRSRSGKLRFVVSESGKAN